MLFLVKTKCPFTVNSQLSRVWIKTGNPKMPLKSVWIDETKLHTDTAKFVLAAHESEAQELTDDHLAFAA